jgi:phosphoserine phosphatase
MLAVFHKAGAKTLLVSGGFTFFTERLKERLGLTHRSQHAGARRRKASPGASRADRRRECQGRMDAKAWCRACPRRRSDRGDRRRANDCLMLAQADISVAYHAKPLVRAACTYAIDYCGLDAVVNLFI